MTGPGARNGAAGRRPASARFPADPSSVADVRLFVSGWLEESFPDLRDAVLVIVSELASNAFRHGASEPYTVALDAIPLGVRMTVTDDGAGDPVPVDPGASGLAGRGLRIVEAFSDSWGVSRLPGTPGKAVWSEVRTPRP